MNAARTLALSAWSILVGGGATVVLLLLDVVGKLYLAGHSIEPRWYDTVGSFAVFGGGLAAAAGTFVVGRRALEGKRTGPR